MRYAGCDVTGRSFCSLPSLRDVDVAVVWQVSALAQLAVRLLRAGPVGTGSVIASVNGIGDDVGVGLPCEL